MEMMLFLAKCVKYKANQRRFSAVQRPKGARLSVKLDANKATECCKQNAEKLPHEKSNDARRKERCFVIDIALLPPRLP